MKGYIGTLGKEIDVSKKALPLQVSKGPSFNTPIFTSSSRLMKDLYLSCTTSTNCTYIEFDGSMHIDLPETPQLYKVNNKDITYNDVLLAYQQQEFYFLVYKHPVLLTGVDQIGLPLSFRFLY